MTLRTCVSPDGTFIYGVHKPAYTVANFRENAFIDTLGVSDSGKPHDNRINFPAGDVNVESADRVYEIPNAFPFKGVTYIAAGWADSAARNPDKIGLTEPPEVSFQKALADQCGAEKAREIIADLPEPLQLALAVTSTDPDDLCRLAELSCAFVFDKSTQHPTGLVFKDDGPGRVLPEIHNHPLFEAVANNPHLPDAYKQAMVLRPGVQGTSEIVGEWSDDKGAHVFEYLRQNSYIPWGHYAANMANDAVRYSIADLTVDDVRGMRGLFYQRTYARLAEMLNQPLPIKRQRLSKTQLEDLRLRIADALAAGKCGDDCLFDATIWGWNFGFDYAPTHYRLHASHQQIHQQYALSPAMMETPTGETMPSFSSSDPIAAFAKDYYNQTGRPFFETYLQAIEGNTRTDGKDGESSLIIYKDEYVMLFVPKAQTSQWELQLMTLGQVGNILEAGPDVRAAIDHGIYTAVQVLASLGAQMITCIEYAKRLTSRDADQRLLYAFLPRLPQSPGSFSEAQLRWINGHYPEDFAVACRMKRDK